MLGFYVWFLRFFAQFLAKMLAFVFKCNVMIIVVFRNSSNFSQIRQFFADCFLKNILKIITLAPIIIKKLVAAAA
jgi:hypothetical protein